MTSQVFAKCSQRKRRSLVESSLRDVPFQLLPQTVYPALQHEKVLKWQAEFSSGFSKKIHFCIAVFLASDGNSQIERLFESLAVQSYQDFSFHVFCGSTRESNLLMSLFERYEIAGSLHQCEDVTDLEVFLRRLEAITADYVILIDGSSILHPQALFIIAKTIIKNPADLLYFNEVELSSDLRSAVSFFRSTQVSKYGLLSMSPFGHLVVVSRAALASGMAKDSAAIFSDACLAWWALGLEFCYQGRNIVHLPLALGCKIGSRLSNGVRNSQPLVKECIRRYANNLDIPLGGLRDVVSDAVYFEPVLLESAGNVQVIVPFRNESEMTINCIRSLEMQDSLESLLITLVDNNSEAEHLKKVEAALSASKLASRANIISDPAYFNYARLNNQAARESNSSYILFLNNDVVLSHSQVIAELRRWCALGDVGAVGGSLFYENGDLQHGGINFACVRPRNISSKQEFCFLTREVNAVTFAMAMVKRSAFNELGGLDEYCCPNGFGDAVFCHLLRKNGWKVIFTPRASGNHFESRTRGRMPEELELYEMVQFGLPISDLQDDFSSLLQPTRLEFSGGNSSCDSLPVASKIFSSISRRLPGGLRSQLQKLLSRT